jgi:hypothetical protein
LVMDLCAWAFFNELVCLPVIEGKTNLRSSYLLATKQTYETMYVLLRVQGS